MSTEQKITNALSQGNLRHDAERTTGADAVGALGIATRDQEGDEAGSGRFGSLLMRLLISNDRACIKPLELLLARCIRRPGENGHQIRRIAEIALREFVDARCRHCGGRGVLIDKFNKVPRECHHCGGRGVGLNESMRMQRLGCSRQAYDMKWRERFDQARNQLQRHHARTKARLRDQLRHEELA